MAKNSTENGPSQEPEPVIPDSIPSPEAAERPRRGRPKLGEARPRIKPLPKPPQMGIVPPLKFFRYWYDTDRMFPLRLRVFVYRRWPTVDRERLGLVKNLELLVVGDKLAREDIHPDTAESTFLHRYGSGSYKLIMNDGAGDKHVMTCVLELRDPMYPPVIEPLESLILEDPVNRPFIEDCRRRGVLLPGETTTEQEEDEMAKVSTEAALATVDKLVDKTVDMAEKIAASGAAREKGTDREKPVVADAISSAVSGMSEAWKVGNEIVKSAVDTASKVNTADPVKTLEGFVSLVKTLNPPASQPQSTRSEEPNLTATLIQTLLDREREARAEAAAAAKEQNELLRTLMLGPRLPNPPVIPGTPGLDSGVAPVAQSTSPAPQVQSKSIIETIRELSQAKDELQNLLNLGEEPTYSPKQSFWEKWLPTILQVSMVGFTTIGNAIYNLSVARSGQGSPAPPPTLDQAGQVTDTGIRQPEGLPTPPSQQKPSFTTDPTMAAYHAYLAELTDPLLQSINNGETGFEFAEKLINWKGEIQYEALRSVGSNKLLEIMSTYPPLWTFIAKIPHRFNQFLEEFMSYGDDSAADQSLAPEADGKAAPQRNKKVSKIQTQ